MKLVHVYYLLVYTYIYSYVYIQGLNVCRFHSGFSETTMKSAKYTLKYIFIRIYMSIYIYIGSDSFHCEITVESATSIRIERMYINMSLYICFRGDSFNRGAKIKSASTARRLEHAENSGVRTS